MSLITDLSIGRLEKTFMIDGTRGMSSSDISEAIYCHAEKHKNPYADWYIEKHLLDGDGDLSFYNKSNSSNPRDDLVTCFSLYDIFFTYVYQTKIHGHTPSNRDKIGIPWRQVTVDEVIKAFNNDTKSVKRITKDSVIVDIFYEKLDKTTEYIKTNFDSEEVTSKLPDWVDLLDLAVYRYHGRNIREGIFKEIAAYCQERYDKWIKEQS